MEEIWKPIPGYEGIYEVSDHGNVRSLDRYVIGKSTGLPRMKRGAARKPQISHKGYFKVGLGRSNSEGYKSFTVHSLVALTFIGSRPEGLQICHNDGDKLNNHVSNLRYDTAKSNSADVIAHGNNYHLNKDECPWGHKLIDPNLVESVKKRGHRRCKACDRAFSFGRTRKYKYDEIVPREKNIERAHKSYLEIMLTLY